MNQEEDRDMRRSVAITGGARASTLLALAAVVLAAFVAWWVIPGDPDAPDPAPGASGSESVRRDVSGGTSRSADGGDRIVTRPFEGAEAADRSRAAFRQQVTFAVLGADGRPLTGHPVRHTFLTNDVPEIVRRNTHETDERGRVVVRLPMGTRLSAGPYTLLVETRRQPECKARLTFAGDPEEPLIDAGTVTVKPEPVLVTGWIVDGTDAPVEGARIGVRGGHSREGRRNYATVPAFSGIGGRFEITGRFDGPFMELSVTKKGVPGYRRVVCETGTRDLRVVLLRNTIRGRLLVSPGVPPSLLHVRVYTGPGSWSGTTPDGDGEFVFRALQETGSFDLKVHLKKDGDDAPLVTFPDVVRAQDGSCIDERVREIDLRALLRPVTLTVKDESGSVIPHAAAGKLTGKDTVPAHTRRGGESGRVQLLVREDRLRDVLVWADGFRPVRVAALARDRTVVLRRGIPVHITLTREKGVPDLERFSVHLLPVGGLGASARQGGHVARPVSKAGAATVHVSGPGRYRVALYVGGSAVGRRGPRILPRFSRNVDVVDGGVNNCSFTLKKSDITNPFGRGDRGFIIR